MQPSEFLDDQVDVLLEGLGSTNGSLVNDEQIEQCQLKHNDVITIGWNTFKLLDGRARSETTAHIIRG